MLFRSLGYVEKAKLARIQHDIKAAESVVNAELTKSGSLGRWGKPKKVNLDEAKNNNQLYNVKGLMSGADEIEGNEFVEIDKSDIGSKLKGDFYASQGGKVYYLNDVSVDEESEEGNDEGELQMTYKMKISSGSKMMKDTRLLMKKEKVITII